MCTADDSKLHSSIALHRTELLKSLSQELLLYSRNNILDSSKILHDFGEEFTNAWENSPNSHTKYIGQYMKSKITFSQSKTRQVLPIMVFHTRGWRLNRLNGVGFCRELSGILQTCCFSWKGHICGKGRLLEGLQVGKIIKIAHKKGNFGRIQLNRNMQQFVTWWLKTLLQAQ